MTNSRNRWAPKKVGVGYFPALEGTKDLVEKTANASSACIRPRPGTSRNARPPIHFPVPNDSTRGLIRPSTSLVPRSMSSKTTHRPSRMARTKTPSFQSNVPGRVGEETYEPSRDLGSSDVSARCIVTIWFFLSGYSVEARCERRSDFPHEGGEVRSAGSLRDICRASDCNAFAVVRVGTSGVSGEGVRDEHNRRIPCTLTIKGLEQGCISATGTCEIH